MSKAPNRNLALELVRVTESAALAAGRWMGCGQKEAGDGAVVSLVMRGKTGTVRTIHAERHWDRLIGISKIQY